MFKSLHIFNGVLIENFEIHTHIIYSVLQYLKAFSRRY